MKTPGLAVVLAFAFWSPVANGQNPTHVVTHNGDSGPGSLRQAIVSANVSPGSPSVVQFAIPGDGPHKIVLQSRLPALIAPIFLDGLSQPGSLPNTSRETNNARLLIELSGEAGVDIGLTMSGLASTVRGMVFNRFHDTCILVDAAFSGNDVHGCWFGIDTYGERPGPTGTGIRLDRTGMVVVGGGTEDRENWFRSLQRNAVEIKDCQHAFIGGNRMDALISGVVVSGSRYVQVDRCRIYGSAGPAIQVEAGSEHVEISGCHTSFPLSPSVGIYQSSHVTVSENTFNGYGIHVQSGHHNRFSRNTILNSQWAIGINLSGGEEDEIGRTANDPLDLDEGANRLQNHPEIQSVRVTDAGTTISGVLNSTPDSDFELEFHRNQAGETTAGRYFGRTIARTDVNGFAEFSVTLPVVLTDATLVAALATDSEGNTSEFSQLAGTQLNVTNYHDIVLSGGFLKDIVATNEVMDLHLVVSAHAHGAVSTETNLTSDLVIELPFDATLVMVPAGASIDGRFVRVPEFSLRPGESNVFNARIVFELPGTFGRHDFKAHARDDGPAATNNIRVIPAYVVAEDWLPPFLSVSLIQATNVAEATWSGWQHTYQIIVTNLNPFPLRGVVLTNYLPSTNLYGARLLSVTGNPQASNNLLVYRLDEIPGGGSEVLEIVVGPTAPSILTNRLEFVLAGEEYRPSVLWPEYAETNGITLTTEARSDIPISNLSLVVQTFSPFTFPGQELEFTAELANAGYQTGDFVMMTNYFSANLQIVSATAPGNSGRTNSFSPGREVIWQPFQLAPGERITARILARVIEPGAIWLSGAVWGIGLEVTPEDNFDLAELTALALPVIVQPSRLNFNTGLFEEVVEFQNQTDQTLPGVRILIAGLPADVVVYNAWGQRDGLSHMDCLQTVQPGEIIRFRVEYYRPSRLPFASPQYLAAIPDGTTPPALAGDVLAIDRQWLLAPGTLLIEFTAEPGARYVVQYSDDMPVWRNAWPPVIAPANRVQWVDSGPPKTETPPAGVPGRFYRVLRVNH